MNSIFDLKEILLEQRIFNKEIVIGLSKKKVENLLKNLGFEYGFRPAFDDDLTNGYFYVYAEESVEIFISFNKVCIIKYGVHHKIKVAGKNKKNNLSADDVIKLIDELKLKWCFDKKYCDQKRITIICGQIDIEILYDGIHYSKHINRIYYSSKLDIKKRLED